MVRVRRGPTSAGKRSGRAAKRVSQKHKVVMESVTQEKKKLRSIISFEAKAPPGYTFIPAGNPKLTTACKESCRRDGLRVFAVTTTPHTHSHNLSQHVHRIGYHFPSTIVASVCMELGLYLTAAGKAVPFYNVGNNEQLKHSNSDASQITINTEARDVLRDLFPNIPDSDLNQIIKTAFQKGQRKVGTAVELPLTRRAQLAVVAHIRHVYTHYDRLLKATSFHEARTLVEQATLAKLVEWRGDDENGKTVLEDVFREVIVISDDEDDLDEEEDLPTSGRDQSVEIISTNPVHEELQTRPINYENPSLCEPLRELSDEDAPPGFRIVQAAPRRNKIDRRGFSRYQAWDRALNRYRRMAESDQTKHDAWYTDSQRPSHAVGKQFPGYANRGPASAGFHRIAPRGASAAPFTGFGQKSVGSGLRKLPSPNPIVERRVSIREKSTMDPKHTYTQPRMREASDPILTLDEPCEPPPVERSHKRIQDVPHVPEAPLKRVRASRNGKPLFQQGGTSDAPIFVSSLDENLHGSESQLRCHPGVSIAYHDRVRLNPQDRALPSIEGPQSTVLEPKRPDHEQLNHPSERMFNGLPIRSVASGCFPRGNIPYQGDDDKSRFPAPTRRRVALHDPVHHDPGLVYPYESPNPASPTTKDAYTGGPFTSLGYILAGRWPNQDDSHDRWKRAAPVGASCRAIRQPENVPKPPPGSAHLDPGFGAPSSGRRHIDHRDTYSSHYHQSTLDAHPREPARCYESPGTRYMIPDDGAFGYSAPMHSPNARAYGGCREGRGLNTNGLNVPGVSEPPVSSVQPMVDGRGRVPNGTHQRKPLYAEGFVQPVGLAGSGVLARRCLRSENELPDHITLASPQGRPRVVYPGRDIHQDTAYDGGRRAAGRTERQYPGLIRETNERVSGAVEQGDPGYVKVAKQPPRYSVPGDRAVFALD